MSCDDWDWADWAGEGWVHASNGREHDALAAWQAADCVAINGGEPETRINPQLSLLRFMPDRGMAHGVVGSPLPSEEYVVSMRFHDLPEESETAEGMRPIPFITEDNIRHYLDRRPPRMHLLDNTTEEQPHLMVLSTGRCGTISLAKLLEQTQYLTYHNCVFTAAASTKFEFMAKLADENYDVDNAEQGWAATRAAEWIGAVKLGRPAAFVGHPDTIFAPIFAKLHPQSKFIYLHRDPVKIFESFYTKNQWNDSQLQPIHYAFPWRWRRDYRSLPESLAWYIKFTETFSRAFGAVMGDRFIEISADKLFALDCDEMWELEVFAGLRMPSYEVHAHFKQPHNAKTHKATVPIDQSILEEFQHEYDAL